MYDKKIISIGRFVENLDYKTNIQDYTTWKEMAKYFKEIYIVVQSPDINNHQEVIDNIHVYWIANKRNVFISRIYFFIYTYFLTKRLVIKNGIDVINVGEPVVAGPVAVKLKKTTHRPFVVQIQGQLVNLPKGTFSKIKQNYIAKMTKYVCKNADKIRIVSKELKQEFVQAGVESEKMEIISSRCDVSVFDPEKYRWKREMIRRELGYSDSNIVLGFVGRVVKYRDLETDLKVMKKISKCGDDYRFLIVGDGDDRERLEKIAKEMKIDNIVNFYGRVPYSAVPQYLASIDIYVSNPTNEALSRSNLEAMAMELPVIISRVGGNREIIDDNINGFLVDVGQYSQIVDVITKKLASKENRELIGKKAREKVVSEYEFETQIQKFANIHYTV